MFVEQALHANSTNIPPDLEEPMYLSF